MMLLLVPDISSSPCHNPLIVGGKSHILKARKEAGELVMERENRSIFFFKSWLSQLRATECQN